MNSVFEIGRVTKDVALRATPSGKSVAQFSLAVPRFKKEDGADFFNCIAWGKTAENMSKYVKQGDRIAVTGRLQSRNYEKDGRRVYVTEIVCEEVQFLEYRRDEQAQVETPVDANTFPDIDPDEVPF